MTDIKFEFKIIDTLKECQLCLFSESMPFIFWYFKICCEQRKLCTVRSVSYSDRLRCFIWKEMLFSQFYNWQTKFNLPTFSG